VSETTRIIVAGLREGINFPKGKYNKNRPFVDLTGCKDIILVDRKYSSVMIKLTTRCYLLMASEFDLDAYFSYLSSEYIEKREFVVVAVQLKRDCCYCCNVLILLLFIVLLLIMLLGQGHLVPALCKR
jgi:hypothetical protein